MWKTIIYGKSLYVENENKRKREENDECVHMFYVHF